MHQSTHATSNEDLDRDGSVGVEEANMMNSKKRQKTVSIKIRQRRPLHKFEKTRKVTNPILCKGYSNLKRSLMMTDSNLDISEKLNSFLSKNTKDKYLSSLQRTGEMCKLYMQSNYIDTPTKVTVKRAPTMISTAKVPCEESIEINTNHIASKHNLLKTLPSKEKKQNSSLYIALSSRRIKTANSELHRPMTLRTKRKAPQDGSRDSLKAIFESADIALSRSVQKKLTNRYGNIPEMKLDLDIHSNFMCKTQRNESPKIKKISRRNGFHSSTKETKAKSINIALKRLKTRLLSTSKSFAKFVLGEGMRQEFQHLTKTQEKLILRNKSYKGMNTSELWSKSFLLGIMQDGDFMKYKRDLETYQDWVKKKRKGGKDWEKVIE